MILVILLAPKELYTWYCPMTIRPLFENTPVLDNNLNINALMTLTMMNKITRNVKWHKISNGTKCQMTQNVKWHKVSNDTKCQMTQNIKWHKYKYKYKYKKHIIRSSTHPARSHFLPRSKNHSILLVALQFDDLTNLCTKNEIQNDSFGWNSLCSFYTSVMLKTILLQSG